MATNYYPSRQFVAFVRMATEAGWTFPGMDLAELAADAEAQREEQSQLDWIEAETAKAKADFAKRQHERFLRFSAALNAARGAFRHDKVISAKLEQFKRKSRTRTKPSDTSPTED